MLSIIVNFHNMTREAFRVIYSLTREYQGVCEGFKYEVIAIDNNSKQKIAYDQLSKLVDIFSYKTVEDRSCSPVQAINEAVSKCNGDVVMIIIDGARILSPGIFQNSWSAFRYIDNPFIITAGFHIGPELQNISVLNGYNQSVEDELINGSGWKQDGYRLFDISVPAASLKRGFFGEVNESNCFLIRKSDWDRCGGYNPAFKLPGGGLANLELFNRYIGDEKIVPVMLLGEATFHQFHGGVASNATLGCHPWQQFENEYIGITGENYSPKWRDPLYIGKLNERSKRFI